MPFRAHVIMLSSRLRLDNGSCLRICEYIMRKHNVQKVKTLSFLFPIYTMYIMHIDLTPKGIYAKLSVSHQYLRQMDQTYAVIPENHMNKTFHISCSIP